MKDARESFQVEVPEGGAAVAGTAGGGAAVTGTGSAAAGDIAGAGEAAGIPADVSSESDGIAYRRRPQLGLAS